MSKNEVFIGGDDTFLYSFNSRLIEKSKGGDIVMLNYELEVCVDSVESAIAAQRAGATRLELCGNLMIGGTTPSVLLYREVRKVITIPIHILIRPRFGDFLYTEYEFNIMKNEIEQFRQEGADGVVFGCLKKDGTLDRVRMEQLVQVAHPMKKTLHRAFDVCSNPQEAIEITKQLGMDYILTSGGKNSCLEGKEALKQYVALAKKDIKILVASKVNAIAIKQILEELPVRCFHMSGSVRKESAMEYRNVQVNMGLPVMSEYQIIRTNERIIEEAVQVLREE